MAFRQTDANNAVPNLVEALSRQPSITSASFEHMTPADFQEFIAKEENPSVLGTIYFHTPTRLEQIVVARFEALVPTLLAQDSSATHLTFLLKNYPKELQGLLLEDFEQRLKSCTDLSELLELYDYLLLGPFAIPETLLDSLCFLVAKSTDFELLGSFLTRLKNDSSEPYKKHLSPVVTTRFSDLLASCTDVSLLLSLFEDLPADYNRGILSRILAEIEKISSHHELMKLHQESDGDIQGVIFQRFVDLIADTANISLLVGMYTASTYPRFAYVIFEQLTDVINVKKNSSSIKDLVATATDLLKTKILPLTIRTLFTESVGHLIA